MNVTKGGREGGTEGGREREREGGREGGRGKIMKIDRGEWGQN